MNRRNFLKGAGAAVAGGLVPMSLIELSFGQDAASADKNFTFAHISDAHIQQIKGNEFVRNWDEGLRQAVAQANLLVPKPDFVVFGGDLGQLAKKAELDHGAEILSGLKSKPYMVMGEHDYYLDMGVYWRELFGPEWYSFDHKGVHFVVLNSILTYDEWNKKWGSDMERMLQMARLDNPQGSPFMVGDQQRAWLKADLDKVDRATPIVVLSHSPIQKIYKGWNFWTDDAEQVQDLLKPFNKVTVIYGHVHQIQYNQIGNISFHAVMSTAWPWPYPESYVQEASYLPKLTVPMNRADPFFERDATGWQMINLETGNVDMHYALNNNRSRVVAFNEKTGRPEDTFFQDEKTQGPPKNHY